MFSKLKNDNVWKLDPSQPPRIKALVTILENWKWKKTNKQKKQTNKPKHKTEI